MAVPGTGPRSFRRPQLSQNPTGRQRHWQGDHGRALHGARPSSAGSRRSGTHSRGRIGRSGYGFNDLLLHDTEIGVPGTVLKVPLGTFYHWPSGGAARAYRLARQRTCGLGSCLTRRCVGGPESAIQGSTVSPLRGVPRRRVAGRLGGPRLQSFMERDFKAKDDPATLGEFATELARPVGPEIVNRRRAVDGPSASAAARTRTPAGSALTSSAGSRSRRGAFSSCCPASTPG
jgi:hypothetical protein